MQNLTKLLYRANEIHKARKLLNKIDSKEPLMNVWKSMISYEKIIKKNGYKWHTGLRVYIEKQCELYLDKRKELLTNNSYKKYRQILERYILK